MINTRLQTKINFITEPKANMFNISWFELGLFISMFSMMVMIPFILKASNGFAFNGNPFNPDWVESVKNQ